MRKFIINVTFLFAVFRMCLAGSTTENAHSNQEIERCEQKDREIIELRAELYQKKINETFVNELRSQIVLQNEIKEALIQELRSQIEFQKQTNNKLQSQIDFQQETISKLLSKCNFIGNSSEEVDVSQKLEHFEDQLNQLNVSLNERDLEIQRINLKITKEPEYEKQLQENLAKSLIDFPTSCLPFGNSSGVHQIKATGFDFFNVLCDSQAAGPGWLVIQQRVGGNESFNKDWDTYRKGFGSFDSDFFLGLEKIHHLTSSQNFELFVHFVALNGSTYNAQYDNFKISDEDNEYQLQLGNGNMEKGLKNSNEYPFSTFDRHPEYLDSLDCEESLKSGWWHNNCLDWNLNSFNGTDEMLHFFDVPLKKVMMLIRPKEEI
ncbi:angiopoietin-related protein 3-like [Drosophila nasuta]|uniref:angiopoietin-related protein 3-like n=1 Tax=Drosophila nasuta TaxID=42062 RepID=UPI00295E6393|nr:angiopoietin-related protein 3-like [Drosophila nasuta]